MKYFVSTVQGLDSQSNKYSWRDNCLIGKQISENYSKIAVRQISWRNKKKKEDNSQTLWIVQSQFRIPHSSEVS